MIFGIAIHRNIGAFLNARWIDSPPPNSPWHMDKRIEKLLAVANDPASTPAEIASARNLIERLSKSSPRTPTLKFVNGIAREPHLEYWTKVYRIVPGGIKTTTCCCDAPGCTRQECFEARKAKGKKSPCNCFCHSTETQEQWQSRRKARQAKKAKA